MKHSAVTSGRLAAYLYVIERGGERVTSEAIAAATGIHATAVRRDLSQMFGREGTRGFGYRPEKMAPLIRAELNGGSGSGAIILIHGEMQQGPRHSHGHSHNHAYDPIPQLIRQGAETAAEIDRLLLHREHVPMTSLNHPVHSTQEAR